jgi:hypothetical protein
MYAVPDVSWVTGPTYTYALADNASDGTLRAPPTITTLPDGTVKLVFDFSVSNYDWTPTSEWYTVLKTWHVYPSGRIALKQDWRISRSGYFSEPQSRNQVSTIFKSISRWGHTWSDSIAGPPGTNSRLNPANKWYSWVPDPMSIQECNAPDGSGGSQDAVHADYNRFHEGANFDFWFWPVNGGLGFEGLGQYKIGYQAFGKSQNATVNEICHHNRTLVGDGADTYNHSHMGWWGGDGATADRYKVLAAGTTWTDSYEMEARPRSATFPADVASAPADGGTPPADGGTTDTKFSFLVIPDTQQETAYKPDLFSNRMSWIKNNKSNLDLRWVLHTGDMVDYDTPDHIQYVRASDGFGLLDGLLPYAIAIGNHDSAATCTGGSACPGDVHANLRNTSTFNTFFPVSRFPAMKGGYESGKVDNAYHTYTAGGLDWLVMNLEVWPRPGVVTWAQGVLAAHPKHNAIIITHSHLNSDSTIYQVNGGYGDTSPQYVYDNLYKLYPNVRLVFSGHVGTSGYRASTGVNGNPIHQLLNCYHDFGNNPTRIVEVDTAANTMTSRVYNPLTNTDRADGNVNVNVSWIR